MPRIKQFEEKYIIRDLWVELDGQSARKGMKTNAALGEAVGVTGQCIGRYREDPSRMRLDTVQKLVKLLKPDIGLLLKFVGYSERDIASFFKENGR